MLYWGAWIWNHAQERCWKRDCHWNGWECHWNSELNDAKENVIEMVEMKIGRGVYGKYKIP